MMNRWQTMNNTFWDDMVKVWCRVADMGALKEIIAKAEKHGAEDIKKKSGYSNNPLDDDEDDDDDFY